MATAVDRKANFAGFGIRGSLRRGAVMFMNTKLRLGAFNVLKRPEENLN
jgi:hypothetical protein